MAGRTLNRRELRKQADEAAQITGTEPAAEEAAAPAAPAKKRVRAKAAATPRVRKTRPKKGPPRLRARWGVFDGSMKQLAIFDYNQRAAADAKLTDLIANKKGVFFLQIVKEPMPEEAPAEEAAPAK